MFQTRPASKLGIPFAKSFISNFARIARIAASSSMSHSHDFGSVLSVAFWQKKRKTKKMQRVRDYHVYV